MASDGHDPSGNGHGFALKVDKPVDDLARRMSPDEPGAERVHPVRPPVVKLGSTLVRLIYDSGDAGCLFKSVHESTLTLQSVIPGT